MNALSRRHFIQQMGAGSAAVCLASSVLNCQPEKELSLCKPLPKQVKWQDAEVGVIFHYDLSLFRPGGWTGQASIHETYDPKVYHPTKLDTDQWIEAAQAMGARYAILTATHFNGFLQWQSDLYPYGVKQAAWKNGKGDLVKEFIESCHKYGIQPGLYMSCFRNAYWKVDQYKVNYGKGGPKQQEFAKTCEKMVKELCSRYGELFQIWFDAGLILPEEGGPDVLPIVDTYQPNMVFYHNARRWEHRWIGNESGYAGYPCWARMPGKETWQMIKEKKIENRRKLLEHGDADGEYWSPGMVDTVLRDHHWFWKPNTEDTIVPLDKFVGFYYSSVGRNANLVMGLTPDREGLLPEPDFKRCEEFGKQIKKRFDVPIANVAGQGAEVILELPEPTRIDHISVMEDIREGERIRAYKIEGLVPGNTWKTLCDGISVGHKRIQQFDPEEVSRVKLTTIKSVAKPLIKSFAVYSTL
jgi:alpha-L-fucosidase